MAESLENKIKNAERILNESFGTTEEQEGQETNRFLNLEYLIEAYKEEAANKEVVKQFLAMSKSVRTMRSSFLSIDFFVDPDSGRFAEEVVQTQSEQESYENAFMRMLGMPSVTSNQFALTAEDSEIRASETLLMLNPLTGLTSNESFEIIKTKILDERQKNFGSRRIKIDNEIYNLDKTIEKISEDEDSRPEELQASIDQISTDLWKFSYLLIPPIQSAEISRSVNEVDKIVAPPFSTVRNRRVNNSELRPSLLESVIRIRLDKVSGTNTFVRTDEEGLNNFELEIGNEEIPVIEDDYGILEALFILRLGSAISGLAQKMVSDIDILLNEVSKTERKPVSEKISTGEEVFSQFIEGAEQFETTEDVSEDLLNNKNIKSLQQQKLIEDSILFLLGDRTEAIDLQKQTQRSSSIHSSHMMSGLIGIVDVPRKRIESELAKIIDSRNETASRVLEDKTQQIGMALGTDIGIGTIDLAVFSLALFTISERSLLGLLSTEQFNRIKSGEFKALLPDEGDKENTVVAINELSQLIIDGYKLFISELEKDTRLD